MELLGPGLPLEGIADVTELVHEGFWMHELIYRNIKTIVMKLVMNLYLQTRLQQEF